MSNFHFKKFVNNPINTASLKNKYLVGIIGDKPSSSAKSPGLWNAVFRELKLKAVYLPFDVSYKNLPKLVSALQANPRLLGFNVTMPYKIQVMPYLNGIDEKAHKIGAVNTVVRTPGGRLIGYNTDGPGAIDSFLETFSGQKKPFLNSLRGLKVTMLGAGGAARAVAFSLAEAIGPAGFLAIFNRDGGKARELADAISRSHKKTKAFPMKDLKKWAPTSDLIINASTVGQLGIRALPNGGATCLEPFSPLAEANVPILAANAFSDDASFYSKWVPKALSEIQKNNTRSLEIAAKIPSSACFIDIIFAPSETRFLSHGRWTGKRTLNGKGMNIAQAGLGFKKIMKSYTDRHGLDLLKTHLAAVQIMEKIK